MASADQAVAIFDSWVGTVESPPHSNRTFIGERFGWNGVAWCAESCSVCLLDTFGRKILWTASVAQAIADAKAGKNGMERLGRDAIIRRGDLVTYDFGQRGNWANFHIAMVRDPGTQVKFQTVGGNENDAVRQQWRDRTYVTGFIRPPYDVASVGSVTAVSSTGAIDMADKNLVYVNTEGEGLFTWNGQTLAWVANDHVKAALENVGLITDKNVYGIPPEAFKSIAVVPGGGAPTGVTKGK